MIQIKNKLTDNVIFEADLFTIKYVVELAIKKKANLSGANLSRADISGANLSRADLSRADLFGADLSRANLSRANLSRADLSRADLSGANLSGADLSRANLSPANLSGANLSGADLSGANLDFSCWALFCGSLKAKTDRKIRIQLAFHLLSLMNYCDDLGDDEREIYAKALDYVNEFHRYDVEPLKPLKP